MKTVNLHKVLELLINEEQEKAAGLLREYYIAKGKAIHESIMAEDEDEDHDSIKDTQDQIEGEEYFSEDNDGDEVEGEEETDVELEPGEEVESADEVEAEEDLGDTIEDFDDALESFEDALERLKAEYAKIKDEDAGEDLDLGDESEDEGEEETTDMDFDFGDTDSLEESWDLETVKHSDQKTDGELVGVGGKTPVLTKSTVLVKSPEDRLAGEPTQIKNPSPHKGYALEKAPAVKEIGDGKNVRKKAMDKTEQLGKEGDKSAVLNSTSGFGSEKTPSPLSGVRRKK